MSQFGKGLTYCIGLFLAHEDRYTAWKEATTEISAINDVNLWFNGASDHLYDLQIPNTLPPQLRKRLQEFRYRCIDLGHGESHMKGDGKEEDFYWAIKEAKDLLRLIDEHYGIKTVEGDHE